MNNLTAYGEELAKIALLEYNIAILKNMEITDCSIADYEKCIFHKDSTRCDDIKKEWMKAEYVEPILDADEYNYLKDVITPFKNNVIGILKIKFDSSCVIAIHYKDKNCETLIQLYPFYDDKMYHGMEEGKEYTLQELKLDE